MSERDVRGHEPCYNIRQDVFGILTKAPRAAVEVWYLVIQLVSVDHPARPVFLPRKLWPDARTLVDLGLLVEQEKGGFTPNLDMFFISPEPTIESLRGP